MGCPFSLGGTPGFAMFFGFGYLAEVGVLSVGVVLLRLGVSFSCYDLGVLAGVWVFWCF